MQGLRIYVLCIIGVHFILQVSFLSSFQYQHLFYGRIDQNLLLFDGSHRDSNSDYGVEDVIKGNHLNASNETNPDSCWHVVWLVPELWEKSYITDMLQEVPLCNDTIRYPEKPQFMQNRTIFITSHRLKKVNNSEIMDVYADRGFVFVTFLTGEESKPNGKSCQLIPEVRFMIEKSALMLRNYWTKECDTLKKVLVVPLYVAERAYKSGFREHCSSLKRPTDRELLFSFSSSHILEERTFFVNAIKSASLKNNKLNETSMRYGRKELRRGRSYPQILSDSRYAGVVAGNVEETWRFTETLFCGAIPVLQQEVYDYYQHWLPPSLLELLPVYYHFPSNSNNNTNIEELFTKLATQLEQDYIQLANNVRKQATIWMHSVHENIGKRFQDLL